MSSSIIFNRSVQFLVDLSIIIIAFILAYIIRFEGIPTGQSFKHLVFQLPYMTLFTMVVYYLIGVRRYIWRYVSLREIKGFLLAHGIVAVVIIVLRLTLPDYFQYARVPLSVAVINLMLAFMGSVGIRALRRLMVEWEDRKRRKGSHPPVKAKRALLIGAGSAGNVVSRELRQRTDLGFIPVGFVDDDPAKRGMELNGVKVLGSLDNLHEIISELRPELLLISIASASGKQMRRIKSICDQTELPVKIVPGVYELIDGSATVSRIRNVEPEDLLGRDPIQLDAEAIATFIKGRRIIVTGAGGSIGSEMCRQVCRFEPESLIVLDQAENALFNIDRELREQFDIPSLIPVIGDICDKDRMEYVFEKFKPQVVIHAAAHKHVPLMEYNPGEAIRNNIFGTKVIADLCGKTGVEKMIMISTDKAVNPTSIMGSTKRIAEIYVQALAHEIDMSFITVRFGNVLGSDGSVIPLFKEQIAKGGPVTVTHPDMIRYFMTIPEASQLVLQAACMGEGGDIFVLDMGEPVRILSLAEDMIRFSGFVPYEGIDIVFTGTRPGEKLFEEIALEGENIEKTKHPKIYNGRYKPLTLSVAAEELEQLKQVMQTDSLGSIRQTIKRLVPEAQFDSTDLANPSVQGAAVSD